MIAGKIPQPLAPAPAPASARGGLGKCILGGAIAGGLTALALGVPTALVPTPYFVRMVPATPWDYLFWVLTSLLVGAFVALRLYGRGGREGTAVGGALGGVLAFGCPICNKLLVALLGASAVLAYVDPYRPAIGAASLALLGAALYSQVRGIRGSRTCVACSGAPAARPPRPDPGSDPGSQQGGGGSRYG